MKEDKKECVVLITKDTHAKLKVYCRERGYKLSHMADLIIAKHLSPREKSNDAENRGDNTRK